MDLNRGRLLQCTRWAGAWCWRARTTTSRRECWRHRPRRPRRSGTRSGNVPCAGSAKRTGRRSRGASRRSRWLWSGSTSETRSGTPGSLRAPAAGGRRTRVRRARGSWTGPELRRRWRRSGLVGRCRSDGSAAVRTGPSAAVAAAATTEANRARS